MIARTWRGRATAANAPAYIRHFSETVAPQIAALRGHRGAWLLRREHTALEHQFDDRPCDHRRYCCLAGGRQRLAPRHFLRMRHGTRSEKYY